MFVALISDQYLKDNTWANQNIDPSIIRPTIRLAQEKYIHPVLGTGLYNKVIGLISGAPSVSLSGNYGTLLHDYIQPCLLWFTVMESTFPIAIRLTNKNIVRKNSDNSTSADLNEVLTMKDECRNNAEWYQERLYLYLHANATAMFAEYYAPGDTIDTIKPRRRSFSSMMSMDNYPQNSSLRHSGGHIPIDYGEGC